MQVYAGQILVSQGIVEGDIFKDSTILLTESNEQGAIGFIINRIAARPLNALKEFRSSPPFPLYCGGPVDEESLFIIHRRPDLIGGGTRVTDQLYMGGDFRQVVQLINKGILDEQDVKIFIGYCGWDAGEIEAEIKEGSWRPTDRNYDFAFAHRKDHTP